MHACTPTTESWRAPRQAPIRRAHPLRRTMSRANAILGALKACRGGCARRMRCLRATTRGPRRRSAQGHAADAAAAREPARRRTRLLRRSSAPAHSAPAQVVRAGSALDCLHQITLTGVLSSAPDRPHRRPQLSARPPLPAASSRVSAGDAVVPHCDALQACGFARRIYGRLPCALPACIRDGYVRDARWQRT